MGRIATPPQGRVVAGDLNHKLTIITQVPVEIGRDSSFKELRALLGRWMGAPPENVRVPSPLFPVC